MRIDAPPTLEQQIDQLRRVMVAAHLGAFRMWIDATEEARIHWDPTMYLLHGLDPERPLEHPAEAIRRVHPHDVVHVIDALARAAQGIHIDVSYRVVLEDGSVRALRVVSDSFERDEDGRLWCLGHGADVTEHQQLTRSVVSANQLSSAVLDTLANEVVILGRDGRILAANARWRDRFPDARLGEPFDLAAHAGRSHGVDPAVFRERFAKLRGGQIASMEFDFVVPPAGDTGRRFVHARFDPIQRGSGQFMGVFTDITELREATVQTLHAQKLEAVGQLASGIAHEINTPIQFIGDNLRFIEDGCSSVFGAIDQMERLLASAPPAVIDADLIAKIREEAELDYLAEEIPTALGQALNGVERVARIVRAMKAFGHPGDPSVQHPADLTELISNAIVVAHNEIKYVADVATEFASLPPVTCFAGDLGQVILNLLVNAAHAIADRVAGGSDRGRIVVRTALEDQRVVVTVADDGGGIPESIAHRVFDPFFTTKEVGRGTGQGLAIARSIVVDRHRGSLTFDTVPGSGTTFRIEIPLRGLEAER